MMYNNKNKFKFNINNIKIKKNKVKTYIFIYLKLNIYIKNKIINIFYIIINHSNRFNSVFYFFHCIYQLIN